MAVDTRNKRASCLGIVTGPAYVFPNPDSALDQADRQQTAYVYPGILATVINVPAFDYFDVVLDWNTATQWALSDRYTYSPPEDLSTVLQRFLQEGTANDSTRQYAKNELIIRGIIAPTT